MWTGRVAAPPKYSAPWSPLIDWNVVKTGTDKGEALFHYWEQQIVTRNEEVLKNLKYITFGREFKRRYPDVPLEFHKIHPPGERVEFDNYGDAEGLGYFDGGTGAFIQCRLFCNIMCFSQFFYAEATHSERQEDFLPAVSASFVYFGGVSSTVAHDYVAENIIVNNPTWDTTKGIEGFDMAFEHCSHLLVIAEFGKFVLLKSCLLLNSVAGCLEPCLLIITGRPQRLH